MSQKDDLLVALGVWLIFASIIPWISSVPVFSSLLLGFSSNMDVFDYLYLFSPTVVILLSLGLIKKVSWTRYGLIIFMLFGLVLNANPVGVTYTAIIIGLLLFSNGPLLTREKSTLQQTKSNTMESI
jgi:hypothetical protein